MDKYIITFRKLKKRCCHNELDWLGCDFDNKYHDRNKWHKCTEKDCPVLKTCRLEGQRKGNNNHMNHYKKHRSKIDTNQTEIVKKLRSIPGVTVALNHDDILVGYKGKTYWYECKQKSPYMANGELRKGALKDSQVKLLAEWKGHYKVIWTFEQIMEEIMK